MLSVSAIPVSTNAPSTGPNSVPMPPMTGPRIISIELRDVENLFGEQIIVEERVEHAGKRRHRGRNHQRKHLVAERIDAGGARRLLVLADGEPEIADTALEQSPRQQKRDRRRGQYHVIEHGRIAAQPPQIVVGVLRDRQKQARRRMDEIKMIEADAGKLGERNSQDGEIDAGDAEAESEKADDRRTRRRDRNRHQKAEPRRHAVAGEQHRSHVGSQPRIDRIAE